MAQTVCRQVIESLMNNSLESKKVVAVKFEVKSRHTLGATEENNENLSQAGASSGRYLNRIIPEYH
jgi:hypothetical protein